MSEPTPRHREFALAGLAALRRARVRAEEIARATGTLLVFVEDGRVVHVRPAEKPASPALIRSVAEQIAAYTAPPPRDKR